MAAQILDELVALILACHHHPVIDMLQEDDRRRLVHKASAVGHQPDHLHLRPFALDLAGDHVIEVAVEVAHAFVQPIHHNLEQPGLAWLNSCFRRWLHKHPASDRCVQEGPRHIEESHTEPSSVCIGQQHPN